MRRGIVITLVLMLCAAAAFAQQFGYSAGLQPVTASGFHKIIPGPDALAHLQPDLRDFRIRDAKGNYVPYIIWQDRNPVQNTLTPYVIVNNSADTAGNTVLDVANWEANMLDNLSFVIKNTNVQRSVRMSGSNNGKEWFIIREDLLLTPAIEGWSDQFAQTVSFPPNKYQYLRFVIDNKGKEPLNIVYVGVYKTHPNAAPGFAAFPAPSVLQKDSNGSSYVYITQQAQHPVERLNIQVSAPRLFERNATLYALADTGNAIVEELATISLSAKRSNDINIAVTKNRRMMLVIANGDNMPLSIGGVTTWYQPKTIVAYFDKGMHTLLMDAADAVKPNYDLEQFRDSIPAKLVQLNYDPPVAIAKQGVEETHSNRNKWIWAAVIAAIAIIAFFTRKLIKDMEKSA